MISSYSSYGNNNNMQQHDDNVNNVKSNNSCYRSIILKSNRPVSTVECMLELAWKV